MAGHGLYKVFFLSTVDPLLGKILKDLRQESYPHLHIG